MILTCSAENFSQSQGLIFKYIFPLEILLLDQRTPLTSTHASIVLVLRITERKFWTLDKTKFTGNNSRAHETLKTLSLLRSLNSVTWHQGLCLRDLGNERPNVLGEDRQITRACLLIVPHLIGPAPSKSCSLSPAISMNREFDKWFLYLKRPQRGGCSEALTQPRAGQLWMIYYQVPVGPNVWWTLTKCQDLAHDVL